LLIFFNKLISKVDLAFFSKNCLIIYIVLSYFFKVLQTILNLLALI